MADVHKIVWRGAHYVAGMVKESKVDIFGGPEKVKTFWKYAVEIHPSITPENAGNENIDQLAAKGTKRKSTEAHA